MKRIIIILLCLLFCLSCTSVGNNPLPPLSLYAFSIGQADCLLLQFGRSAILIDTGERNDGDKIVKKLEECGVERLDILILTHFDKDHIGGAEAVISSIPIDAIIMPYYESSSKHYKRMMSSIDSKGVTVSRPATDISLSVGGANIDIFVSPVPYDGHNDNEQSLVTRLVYNGKTYLFTGDAEKAWLSELVSGRYALGCDMLKLPHHGSYDANLDALLCAAAPEYVIICDSEKHPTPPETLDAIVTFGAAVLQTQFGAIHLVETDGVLTNK